MKFHHIGVACNNLEKERDIYTSLGYQIEGHEFIDSVQKIKGIFMVSEGQPRLELLCDISEDGPVAKHLKTNNKYYHFAYEVENIEQALSFFQNSSYCLVPPTPAAYFKRVCFLMLRNKSIIELVEIR